MEGQKVDILNRADVVNLLREFYSIAIKDDVIGTKFTHLAMDEHIEIIADFWDSILFGKTRYQGDPFSKHIPLNLHPEHFERWLKLFNDTVDRMFRGSNSDEAKHRALTIARVFQFKLTGS